MKTSNTNKRQTSLKDTHSIMHSARLLPCTGAAILLGLAASGSLPGAASAEEGVRGGKTEVYLMGMYMDGNTVQGTSSGTTVDLEPSVIGGGVGVGYNINDHLSLNAELGLGSAEVKGSAMGMSTTLKPTAYSTVVGLDWNVLKTPLTPVLSGSGGFIGYTGDGVSEANWLAGVGGGLRWDISDKIMAKLLYRANFSSFQDVNDTVLYHTGTLSVGWKF